MSSFPATGAGTQAQDHAGAVLERAFVPDPMFLRYLPDPARRAASLPLLFRAMARQSAEHGLIDTDPRGRGAALWLGDGHGEIGVAETLRHGYVRFGLTAGLRDALLLMRAQSSITAHHDELLPGPHGYLFALGVEPAEQGRGVGSALLEVGCARLDALGLPGYLETNVPANVRLYERFGFEVRRRLPGDGPERRGFDTWLMVRPG